MRILGMQAEAGVRERAEDLVLVEQTLAVFAERCIETCLKDGMPAEEARALVAAALRRVAEDLSPKPAVEEALQKQA